MNVLSKFHVTRDENVDLSCFKESCNYVDNTPAGLLSHYRTCHRKDKSFSSLCLHSRQCFHAKAFRTYDTLYKHMLLYHSISISAPPAAVLSNNTVDEVNIQNDGESQKHSFISSSSKIVELEFGLV